MKLVGHGTDGPWMRHSDMLFICIYYAYTLSNLLLMLEVVVYHLCGPHDAHMSERLINPSIRVSTSVVILYHKIHFLMHFERSKCDLMLLISDHRVVR